MTDTTDYSLQTFSRGAFFIGANYPFDLNIASRFIGIKPTYLWTQQKEHLKGLTNFPQATWAFELPPQEYDTIDTPVNEILDIFLPLRDKIIPFIQEHNLEASVDVMIHMYESNMGCHMYPGLEVVTLKRLAEFGVPFQITHRFHYGDDVSIDD